MSDRPSRRRFRWPRRSAAQVAADVDAELEFHLAMYAEELVAAGWDPDAARAEARRRFGDVEGTRQYCRAVDGGGERARRRADVLGDLLQDLRVAARQLRRAPGFAVAAVLTLALGIGAATAVFGVVDGVLLRPLPYVEVDRVLALQHVDTRTGQRGLAAPGDFMDWRERARTVRAAAALPYGFDVVSADGRPETIQAWLATEGFFDVLGARPALGRGFLPDDHLPYGQSRVVLVSHGFWQRRFGGDSGIIGRTLDLDGRPHVVVGVLPATMRYPEERELWAPVALDDESRDSRGDGYIHAIARLRPGHDVGDARAELDAIARQLAVERPRTNSHSRVAAVPLREEITAGVRPALLVLLAAVTCILLIACANVANLLLARGAARRRELAVRAALGAGGGRLVRQLLTESLVLAVLGGAAGLLLAHWGLSALVARSPVELPAAHGIALDGRVLLFAVLLTALTTVLFGLLPALRAARTDARTELATGPAGTADRGGRRLRAALVGGEIALAEMLVVAAGLLGRSLAGVLRVELGFQPEERVALQVFLWDRQTTAERRIAFVRDVERRLAALPGVRGVGVVSALPFLDARIDIEVPVQVEGRDTPDDEAPVAFGSVASPGYFATIGTPLRRGRVFTEADDAAAPPVAVVNEAFARRVFPGEDPIGKRISLGVAQRPRVREIVGVVADARQTALEAEPRPEVFVPHAQSGFGSMTFVVRTAGDPARLVDALRAEIWALDPDLPIYDVATLSGLLDEMVAARRFAMLLVGALAALALVLAAVGIYGVVSVAMRERTREFGVRLALGARGGDVTHLALRDTLAVAVGGVAAGALGAAVLARLLRGHLYGVGPTDPLTFGASALVLVGVALLAGWLPARRAARTDPLVALRAD